MNGLVLNAMRTRVLVVDDNHDTADATATLLQLRGFDVDVAYNGRSAIEKAKRLSPDFLVLDLTLPDIDGYAVAARLRGEGLTNASLIAVSGQTPVDDEVWRDLDFTDYLVKPIDHEALISLLSRAGVRKPA